MGNKNKNMSSITSKITNILFISFLLMSAFSSIKLKKTNKHEKDSFIKRHLESNMGENIQKIDQEFKKNDAKKFGDFMKIKSLKNAEEAKFFKSMNDEAASKNAEIPRYVKRSSSELAKIHERIDRTNFVEGKPSPLQAIQKTAEKNDIKEEVFKPEQARNQQDISLAKDHENNYRTISKEVKAKPISNGTFLGNLKANSVRVEDFQNYEKNLFNENYKTMVQRHKEDTQMAKKISEQHHEKKNNSFNVRK